jgi:hypothetical protein
MGSPAQVRTLALTMRFLASLGGDWAIWLAGLIRFNSDTKLEQIGRYHIETTSRKLSEYEDWALIAAHAWAGAELLN